MLLMRGAAARSEWGEEDSCPTKEVCRASVRTATSGFTEGLVARVIRRPHALAGALIDGLQRATADYGGLIHVDDGLQRATADYGGLIPVDDGLLRATANASGPGSMGNLEDMATSKTRARRQSHRIPYRIPYCRTKVRHGCREADMRSAGAG